MKWIISILVMLLLMGCMVSKENTSEVMEPEVDDTPVLEEAPIEPEPPQESEVDQPEVQEKEETPEPNLPAQVQQLVLKSKNVKNMHYVYTGPELAPREWELFIRGDSVKILLPSESQYDPDTYFDTVYLDDKARTAVGFCEDAVDTRCPDSDKEFDVEYARYVKMKPTDWMNRLDNPVVKEGETIDGRETLLLVDGDTSLWVESYYGVPLRVVTPQGQYSYEEFSTTVRESDVSR